MTDKLKIRPFDRTIDFRPLPQVRCTGVIDGHGLVVCLGESRFDLVGELGSDEYGHMFRLSLRSGNIRSAMD